MNERIVSGSRPSSRSRTRRRPLLSERFSVVSLCGVLLLGMILATIPQTYAQPAAPTKAYGNVGYSLGNTLACGWFNDVWDIQAAPLVISFIYDARGLDDTAGARASAQLGVREVGYGCYSPAKVTAEGVGVWFATDYDAAGGTLGPDPIGSPIVDLDDKLFLARAQGISEGAYNLPAVPPDPLANHRFWFDRDGVDPWQALIPTYVNGGTYNTGGRYQVVLTLNATGPNTGTASMTVNGLAQGFETNGDWNTMELSPAGMTFIGDMTRMQVFHGFNSYGANPVLQTVLFENVVVTGALAPDVAYRHQAYLPLVAGGVQAE